MNLEQNFMSKKDIQWDVTSNSTLYGLNTTIVVESNILFVFKKLDELNVFHVPTLKS